MTASTDLHGSHILTCATCQIRFVLGDFDPEVPYRCARCDRALTHPSGSFDTLRKAADPHDLYGVHHEAASQQSRGRLGRYEPYEVLGRGGMGVVYRARDLEVVL